MKPGPWSMQQRPSSRTGISSMRQGSSQRAPSSILHRGSRSQLAQSACCQLYHEAGSLRAKVSPWDKLHKDSAAYQITEVSSSQRPKLTETSGLRSDRSAIALSTVLALGSADAERNSSSPERLLPRIEELPDDEPHLLVSVRNSHLVAHSRRCTELLLSAQAYPDEAYRPSTGVS